jgi:hypothetical protein
MEKGERYSPLLWIFEDGRFGSIVWFCREGVVMLTISFIGVRVLIQIFRGLIK